MATTTINIWGAAYTIELGADGDTPDAITFPTWERRPDIAGLEWLETAPPFLASWRNATADELRTARRIAYATPVQASAGTSAAAPELGPWATYGLPRAVWLAVADHVAERGTLPAVADVIAATGCGEGDAARAVVAYARYHGLVGEGVGASPCCRSFLARAGGPHEAGCPAAKPKAATPGSVYLDLDGELVQVLPATAWDSERWGPAEPGLTVCRVLASAPRYEATGEVVQRDLRGAVLLRDAAGRVPAALRALAGAEGGS